MRTLSLRASLTLWFVGLTMIVVGASSTALYLGVRDSLFAGLDAELLARAEGVAALCEWEDGEIALEGAAEAGIDLPLLGPDHAIEIRHWPGLELAHSFGPPMPGPGSDDPITRTSAPAGGSPQRIYSLQSAFPPIEGDEAQPAFAFLIRVATPLEPVYRQLDQLAWLVAGIGVLSLGVVIGFGLFLSQRVTRPLRALGNAAAAVRVGASTGMPRRGADDEIDQLAAVLDETFGALRSAIEEQRRFTADASHELRTPVAILQSQSEIALRRLRTPEEYATTLHEIHATAQRMGRILEALLTMTRLDVGQIVQRQTVDLTDVVRDAVASARARSSKQVELESNGRAIVGGDQDLLRILVENLLSNAVRHSVDRVEARVRIHGDAVELTVRDDGPGIPAADRSQVFRRFFRGSNVDGQPGAGLGLALVASISRVHGGTCEIHDDPAGQVFRVRLPASSGSAQEP